MDGYAPLHHDGAAGQHAVSAPQDVAIWTSIPQPPSTHTMEGSHAQSASRPGHNGQHHPSPHEVWSGAISRLQTQVSFNTSMLESQRRDVSRIDNAVSRLQGEMGSVMAVLDQVRMELRSRPGFLPSPQREGPNASELDILAGQVEAAARKANEVEPLRLQVDLMKVRVRKFEEQLGSPSGPGPRPGTSSSHQREPSFYASPPPQNPHAQHLPPQVPYPQHQPSPAEPRPPPFQHRQMPSQATSRHQHSTVPSSDFRNLPGRPSSTESRTLSQLPPSSEVQAPPLAGWRPSAFSLPSVPPAPPPQARPPTLAPEPQPSGWAAVNVNQAAKRSRPFDERPSPYESPTPGSPKRPKLAPLVPRSSFGEEHYTAVPPSYQQAVTIATSEDTMHPQSHHHSTGSQLQAFPASAQGSMSSFRFIPSTGEAQSQDSWRPEFERLAQEQIHQVGRGRGKERGSGRGRGRRGGNNYHQHESPPELGISEWEKPDWTGSQMSPNSFYNPTHPHSPGMGGLIRRSGGHAEGPADRPHEMMESPLTPINIGAQDAFVQDGSHSEGRKTRTKPIRNAEGILIRKDGRPDMRSVSSANNLRKVHAKKEAERAEQEGRTPTSAFSLAPAGFSEDGEGHSSASQSEPADGDERQPDAQEQHQALMRKMFPHGVEAAGGRSVGEQFFPRPELAEAPDVKVETESEKRAKQDDVEMEELPPHRPAEEQEEHGMTAE